MQLPIYKSAFSIPLSEEQIAIRREFVSQYVRDYNARAALLRMGQPANLVDKMAEMYLQDNWVQVFLKQAEESFGSKIGSRDEILRSAIASKIFEEACNCPKDSVRLAAMIKVAELLQLNSIRPNSETGNINMTPEEIKNELIRRGHQVPDKIFNDQFN